MTVSNHNAPQLSSGATKTAIESSSTTNQKNSSRNAHQGLNLYFQRISTAFMAYFRASSILQMHDFIPI